MAYLGSEAGWDECVPDEEIDCMEGRPWAGFDNTFSGELAAVRCSSAVAGQLLHISSAKEENNTTHRFFLHVGHSNKTPVYEKCLLK